MEILGERPVWSMSGSEMLSSLDAAFAEIARLETFALHLMAGLETTGYAQELGAGTTARLLTFRYRIDAPKPAATSTSPPASESSRPSPLPCPTPTPTPPLQTPPTKTAPAKTVPASRVRAGTVRAVGCCCIRRRPRRSWPH